MALGLPRRAAVTDQDSDAHSQAPLVFVVNDDTAFLQLMQELLGEEGYRCRTLMSSKDAHVEIRENQPDLVILDIRINNEEAGLLVLDLLTIDPATCAIPVIVASADLQALANRQAELVNKGIYVLPKPFDIQELGELMKRAMAERRGARRVREPRAVSA
jgi:DNA-binding NtrC family response regulator